MRRLLWLALVPLFGCGGGGGSTSQQFPFDGQWNGTWSCPNVSESGSMAFTVGGGQPFYPEGHSAFGTFSGTTSGDLFNSAVSSSGSFVVRFYEDGFLRFSAFGNFQVTGSQMTSLPGTVIRVGGVSHPASFSLSR